MQPNVTSLRFSHSRLRRRVLALGLTCALAAPQAHALSFFDPTAALRVALLARIATITGRILALCDDIARASTSIQERQELMFPVESLEKIGSVFQTVRSLRDDFDRISAQYTLAFDADEFRRSLVGEQPLERGTLESLWGKASGPSRDLDEYTAWSAHRRYLSVSSFLSVHDQWQDAASSLAHQARTGGPDASAGHSLRLTGVAASMGLQQATVANQLAAERLDAAQEALDLARYEALLADALGDVLLAPFARASQPTTISGVPDDVRIGGVL